VPLPAGLLFEVLDTCQGLRRCDSFLQQCGRYFYFYSRVTNDFRHKLRTVWRDVEEFNSQDTNSKLAIYHSFCSATWSQCACSLFVCRNIRIWICFSMSCKMFAI
jgi:hypothetical protein